MNFAQRVRLDVTAVGTFALVACATTNTPHRKRKTP